jgi:hypothetical protein
MRIFQPDCFQEIGFGSDLEVRPKRDDAAPFALFDEHVPKAQDSKALSWRALPAGHALGWPASKL